VLYVADVELGRVAQLGKLARTADNVVDKIVGKLENSLCLLTGCSWLYKGRGALTSSTSGVSASSEPPVTWRTSSSSLRLLSTRSPSPSSWKGGGREITGWPIGPGAPLVGPLIVGRCWPMLTGMGDVTLRWRGMGILGLLSCSRSRLPGAWKLLGPPCCMGVEVRGTSV
jgi:hypothetical protein